MAATTTFVKEKTTLVMKLETTSGTAISLSSSDFNIKFFDISVSPEIETYAQLFASGRHSKGQATMGKKKITFTAKAQLLTSTTAGTEPALGTAWKVCGMNQTMSTGVSNTYNPDATKDEGVTATIAAILVPTSGNAVIITGKGCMGNCILSMDALGAPLVAQFTFTGAFVSVTDGAALALTSPDTGYAPSTVGSLVTMTSGDKQQVSKFSLDFGNSIELDQDPYDTTGYAAAYIAKRDPKLMLTTKLKKLADDAHYTRWAAGTEAAFSLATAANGSSLKYTVAAPKAQLLSMPLGNSGEEWAWNQTYELHENSGDDEFTIVLSA